MGLNKLATYVLRAIPGAFILNAGLGKLNASPEMAQALHSQAVIGLPPLAQLEPEQFAKLLPVGEIALGSALLAPFVPNRLAGLGLTAFAGGLLSMYFRNPEMTEEDGIRPSGQGIPLAKDSWLAAIGIALVLAGSGRRDKRK